MKQLVFQVFNRFCRPMSSKTLIQSYNPVTGQMDWKPVSEHYDYVQEIARSGFGDMLHDHERNVKYQAALEKAIDHVRSRNQQVHVLDIGTGTGLLAMMAARYGADSVTACEAFEPMQYCSRKVIELNGCADKIRVIHKRSTEMTEADMGKHGRANVLVTEVFDTELIGEGAVPTFRHALQHLLTPDCLVVPSKATVFAQPVYSPTLHGWSSLNPPGKLKTPNGYSDCKGSHALHDLQLSQLREEDFTTLAEPLEVFSFDFTRLDGVAESDHTTRDFRSLASGPCTAVFMWWSLQMDFAADVILSCAPRWAHPDGDALPWRDHWMQAVYHVPATPVERGQNYKLHSYHDEHSNWFCVQLAGDGKKPDPLPTLPFCTCGVHRTISHTRLAAMNDASRRRALDNVARKAASGGDVILYIGDTSWLPLQLAEHGASQVLCFTADHLQARVLQTLVLDNDLAHKIKIICKSSDSVTSDDLLGLKPKLVVTEPFFSSGLLPWHHVASHFVFSTLKPLLHEEVRLLPATISLHVLPLEFEHLWKLRAPLGTCEGFDLQPFDRLLMSACLESDPVIEPQPLWEYPGKALASPSHVMTLNLGQADLGGELQADGQVPFETNGSLNGIAVWATYTFAEDCVINTGPVATVTPGEVVTWDRTCRQGVYFPVRHVRVNKGKRLTFSGKFDADEGEFHCDFSVDS